MDDRKRLAQIRWYANKLGREGKLNGRCTFFLDEIVRLCEEQAKDAERLLPKRKKSQSYDAWNEENFNG